MERGWAGDGAGKRRVRAGDERGMKREGQDTGMQRGWSAEGRRVGMGKDRENGAAAAGAGLELRAPEGAREGG